MEDFESRSESGPSRFDSEVERRVFDCLVEFAAGAGHELNNPFAVISGLAQNLLRDETNDEKRRALARIVEQTQVGYEMLASLRLFARPPQPKFEKIDALELFRKWRDGERKRAEEKGASIEIREEIEDAIAVETDVAALLTALGALVKNAIEATADGGKVAIFSRRVDDVSVEFGVEDGGRGLTDRERELAFAPYFSGRRAGRGLGFGLSLARRYAESLNAALAYRESETFDSGSIWSILVPIASGK